MFFNKKNKRIRKSSEGKLVSILDKANISTFLDVGANIGQTHDKIRQAGYKNRIVSFEPVPAAHAEIMRKSASDKLWDIAPRMAIGAEKGDAEINVSESSDMSSFLPATDALLDALPKTKTTEKVITSVYPLDSIYSDFCSETENVFLKIDTQGFEREVLNGAKETLLKVKGLQMELSLFPLYEGEETYLSFLNDLHAMGFEPYMLFETNFSRPLNRQLQIDAVFMRSN